MTSYSKAQAETGEFQRLLRDAIDERVKFVLANREKLLEAWVAEHGMLPSEAVLIEQTLPDGTLRVYVTRKRPEDR